MATPPPRRSAMITREGAGMVSLLVIASGCGELDGDDEERAVLGAMLESYSDGPSVGPDRESPVIA